MKAPRWAQSLKTRLAALFFVGLLVLLFFGGGFVLSEQEHSLLHNIDSSLTARADDIVALLEDATNPRSLGIARDEDTIAMILDSDGTVLTSTDRFGDPSELEAGVSVPSDRGSTIALPSFRETQGTNQMRVVRSNGPRGETIFVAQSLARIDDNLAALQQTMLTVGLLVSAAAGVLCWVVVHRALRPVSAIVNQASDISLARLDRRLPEPVRRDEIGELTQTLNAMLARLESSADQQRRLISDIAHELRSPLTAVSTQLEVDLTHPEIADWPATANEVLDETRRLQRLIDDMLAIARFDDTTAPPIHRLVDLDEVVLHTITRHASSTPIHIDQSGVSAGLVHGDRSQLERAIQNLLDNAVRHAAGKVTVRLQEESDVVRLDVIDDGPGIPIADREKVFNRFYRTQAARDRDSGGTGLGLAITRETILAHGGTIRVSEATPHGAAFTVTLPTVDPG